jgi:hemolysin activation/secretion protein
LYTGVSGQFANTNLDSGEKFSLGGPTALRAYSGGEASGDEGWLANVELRYELPAFALGQPRLVGFYDVGGIKLHKDTRNLSIQTATGRNDYSLSGFGIGAELGKADLYQLRLVWAKKIGDNPGRTITGMNSDGRDLDNQFWLQGAFWF